MSSCPSPPVAPPRESSLLPLVAGLGLTQIIGYGTTFYILAVLAEAIGRDLALSSGMVLGGLSLWLLVGAVVGPRLGRWQDHAGARRVMGAGSALQAAGLVMLALASGPASYYAAWGVLGVASPLTLYPAAFTALTQVDARRARRSISTLTFFGGFASTLFWPLTGWLAAQMDWRTVLLLYAALNALFCLPLHLLLLAPAPGRAQNRGETGATLPPGLSHAGQNIAFLLFAAMMTLQALAFYMVSTLVLPMLAALGHGEGSAIFIASLIGPAQVAGRLADMLAAARLSALMNGLISAALLPLAFAALAWDGGGGLSSGILFALLYGISNGLLTIARGGITLAIFGSHGYGERLNRVLMPPNFLGATAPILGGIVVDRFGAQMLVPLLLALALASAALMLALKRHCARQGLD